MLPSSTYAERKKFLDEGLMARESKALINGYRHQRTEEQIAREIAAQIGPIKVSGRAQSKRDS